MVNVGDTVQWSNGRKPLGKVVHKFSHGGTPYAVVLERRTANLKVVRISTDLRVLEGATKE